jgi:alkylation response protein AidB-like acyl-CoA dehydrogenase
VSGGRFRFGETQLPPTADGLRQEVREFMARQQRLGHIPPRNSIAMAFSAAFSEACGEQGYIGMTWPRDYGGGERSALERYVVTEELLAAGAPVRGHWTSDRQSGPVILRFGTDAQKEAYLPGIAAGKTFFCIGLSEADSGSDLASVRTRADRKADGWLVNGAKLWTTNAHNCQYIIALCRTLPQQADDRYHGLSQFIIDLRRPGVSIRPIINLAGEHDFNEVVFEDVCLPSDALLGTLHEGWRQVSAELAYERSGPERWLSTFRLLAEFNAVYGPRLPPSLQEVLGGMFAQLFTLREMSLSIAGMLQNGEAPTLEASIVKDLGTVMEQSFVRLLRDMVESVDVADAEGAAGVRVLLESAMLIAPIFTLRGGTTEILRNTIARGLQLR